MVDRRPNFVTVISCPKVYSGGSIRWWNNFDQSLYLLAVLTLFWSVPDRQTDGWNCYINIVRYINAESCFKILYIVVTEGAYTRPLFVYATATV